MKNSTKQSKKAAATKKVSLSPRNDWVGVTPGDSTSLWRWPFIISFQADDIYSRSDIKKWTWQLMVVKGRMTYRKGQGADLKPDDGSGRQDLLSLFSIFTSAHISSKVKDPAEWYENELRLNDFVCFLFYFFLLKVLLYQAITSINMLISTNERLV